MEEKQDKKVQVIVEIDRSEYDAYLFLCGLKKDEDTERAWEVLAEEPVTVDCSQLGDEERTLRLAMVSLAILSVGDKLKKIKR